MRKKEQDYPSRAEYAAALNWWEVLRVLASVLFRPVYRERIIPPEGYGVVKRLLVNASQPFRANGKLKWWFQHVYTLVLTAIVLVGMWFFGSRYESWGLIWLWLASVFVVVVSVSLCAMVLIFRAGGWEPVLAEIQKKLAWKEELKVLRGDRFREDQG